MENIMLIVDDNIINRRIISSIFKDKYNILEAASGEEALDILEERKGNVDIMLLDTLMPGMGGFGVLKLRKTLDYAKNVPVVMITSSNAIEDQIKAFSLGANDFINKPFIPQIVVSRVNNVIASTKRLSSIKTEAERLKVKSEIDGMTGLLNKSTTEALITEALQSGPQYKHALLLIDVDNFKNVNDSFGHLIGDDTIKIVADCISGLFRKTDIIGRVGGDEFVVLMTNVPSISIVRSKVTELIEVMKYKPNLTLPANVSASIGYTISDESTTDYAKLFARADEALYTAKLTGKARGFEYGAVDEEIKDEREVVLIISRNKILCSLICSCCCDDYKIVELESKDEMEILGEDIKSRIILTYIDISDMEDGICEYLDTLKITDNIFVHPVIGICQESNLLQYKEVIVGGVSDVITLPVEKPAFKRRSSRYIMIKEDSIEEDYEIQ